jgi:hypothetical protein
MTNIKDRLHAVVDKYMKDLTGDEVVQGEGGFEEEDRSTTGAAIDNILMLHAPILNAFEKLLRSSYSPAQGVPDFEDRQRKTLTTHCWRMHRAIDAVNLEETFDVEELAELERELTELGRH